MKKLIGLLGLFVLTNGALSSCSNDDNTKKEEENNNEITIESSKGTYLGTTDKKGKFAIQLHSKDAELELILVSDVIADKDLLDAELKPISYVVTASGDLYTISTDSYLKKGDVKSNINAGNLSITHTADNYTIKGHLIDSQNISYAINYTGLLDIEPIYETQYEIQNGWFWGDDQYDYPNIGEYMSFFTQGQANKYGELEGDGYHISLSFFDAMPAKAWEAKIPNKTYKASRERKEGTFLIQAEEDLNSGKIDYTYAFFLQNKSSEGIAKALYITDGTIKTMDDAKGQQVRFNIELQDGSRHVGKYTGKVRQGDEYTISSLKTDRAVGALDYGYIEYVGKSPIEGKENNRWNIYLYNKGVSSYPQYYWSTEGTGEYLRLTIYTDVNATTDIPAGVYPIGQEKAGVAGLGGGTEVGLDFGTWFFELKNDDYINSAPTRTGTVTIAKTGTNYSIQLDAVDDRANKITANYSGALAFHNSAKKPAAKAKSTKATTKSFGKGKAFDIAKNLKNRK